MKEWVNNNAHLLTIYNKINKYGSIIPVSSLSTKRISSFFFDRESRQSLQIDAVKKIQTFWRKYKIKEAFVNNAYGSYLSMISLSDTQYLLSSMMLGRHQASLKNNGKDRVMLNPYIPRVALYHRWDDLSDELMRKIKKEFNLSPELLHHKIIIPITALNTVPIESVINKLRNDQVQLIKNPSYSISLVLLDESEKEEKWAFIFSGLIASPWEIALNIRTREEENLKPEMPAMDTQYSCVEHSVNKSTNINENIYIKGLPNSKNGLLNSNVFNQLNQIALNTTFPTHLLACSLVQMIKNIDLLSPEAIQRVSLIIDMANTFYSYNYPQFAQCVNIVIHEFSLSIAVDIHPNKLTVDFERFFNESKKSLSTLLGLNQDELCESTFIASPALSGTNAFMISKRIALAMKSELDNIPTIDISEPNYFELRAEEFDQSLSSDSDIYVICTGPIFDREGTTPGMNLNAFAREKIIRRRKTKSTTFIVDATTTLYKNLHLDDDVKKIVQDGMLSLIIFESRQKFGLLHSDQAQYGLVRAFCSKKNYRADELKQIQLSAQLDFNQHIDMRMGAYINYCCEDTLEQIKQQHFSNGALCNDILNHTKAASKDPIQHKLMSKKTGELYFVRLQYNPMVFLDLVQFRESFGHYSNTLSFVNGIGRLCANASDEIDSLIFSSRIYLALVHPKKEMIRLEHSKDLDDLSHAEKIICIAMTQNLISSRMHEQPTNLIDMITLYFTLKKILGACNLFKGREAYNEISRHFHHLEKKIFSEYDHFKHNESITIELIYIFSIFNYTGFHIDTEIRFLTQSNQRFCDLIIMVYNESITILSHLKEKETGAIYEAGLKYAPDYLNECFFSIKCFITAPTRNHHEFTHSIAQANKKYCEKVVSTSMDSPFFSAMNQCKAALNTFISPSFKSTETSHSKYRFFTMESGVKSTEICERGAAWQAKAAAKFNPKDPGPSQYRVHCAIRPMFH